MGRELKRKNAKKNRTNTNIKEENPEIKVSTFVKLVIFIPVIILVLYYVIAVFITKEIDISWSKDNDTTENTNEVSNKILAQNILKQPEESYYVYFYDFSDKDESISSLIETSEFTIYHVDTGSALNKNYVTEDKSNPKATTLDELKVKNPTLIKVSADKITEYYEGSSEIANALE